MKTFSNLTKPINNKTSDFLIRTWNLQIKVRPLTFLLTLWVHSSEYIRGVELHLLRMTMSSSDDNGPILWQKCSTDIAAHKVSISYIDLSTFLRSCWLMGTDKFGLLNSGGLHLLLQLLTDHLHFFKVTFIILVLSLTRYLLLFWTQTLRRNPLMMVLA